MFTKKIVKKPFFNPSQPINTTSDSPTDLANKEIKRNNRKNNAIINFTEGKYNTLENFKNKHNSVNQNGYGRTLNVPKELPSGILPGPSYNGGITIGKKCKGNHCSLPILPTSYYMINKNLKNDNLLNNALYQIPSTYRLGNNSDIIPGIKKYTNTGLNSGPFNIDVHSDESKLEYIVNPKTNRKVKVQT